MFYKGIVYKGFLLSGFMGNYKFEPKEFIEASKSVVDDQGSRVYDDLVGIAYRAFPEEDLEVGVNLTAERLLRRSRIHRHGRSHQAHFLMLSGFEAPLVGFDAEELTRRDANHSYEMNAETFARAFKAYENGRAFQERGRRESISPGAEYPAQVDWEIMQAHLAGLLR